MRGKMTRAGQMRENRSVTDDEVVLRALADHYQISGVHAEFRNRFGARFTYALPSVTAGFSRINPKGPEPRDYIVYALSEAQHSDPPNLINAVANAKRAVHLAVESLVQLYCLAGYARKRGFPGLLALFQNLGAFPTRLMAALNRRRNEIEHEYQTPSMNEVGDFTEMAELFVGLCYRFFRAAVIGVYTGHVGAAVCHEYQIDPQTKSLLVSDVVTNKVIVVSEGPIHYNIQRLAARTLVRTVPLDADHEAEWSSVLALLTHCTNSNTYRLHELGQPGEIVPTLWELELSSERDASGRVTVRTTQNTYAPTSSL